MLVLCDHVFLRRDWQKNRKKWHRRLWYMTYDELRRWRKQCNFSFFNNLCTGLRVGARKKISIPRLRESPPSAENGGGIAQPNTLNFLPNPVPKLLTYHDCMYFLPFWCGTKATTKFLIVREQMNPRWDDHLTIYLRLVQEKWQYIKYVEEKDQNEGKHVIKKGYNNIAVEKE